MRYEALLPAADALDAGPHSIAGCRGTGSLGGIAAAIALLVGIVATLFLHSSKPNRYTAAPRVCACHSAGRTAGGGGCRRRRRPACRRPPSPRLWQAEARNNGGHGARRPQSQRRLRPRRCRRRRLPRQL